MEFNNILEKFREYFFWIMIFRDILDFNDFSKKGSYIEENCY